MNTISIYLEINSKKAFPLSCGGKHMARPRSGSTHTLPEMGTKQKLYCPLREATVLPACILLSKWGLFLMCCHPNRASKVKILKHGFTSSTAPVGFCGWAGIKTRAPEPSSVTLPAISQWAVYERRNSHSCSQSSILSTWLLFYFFKFWLSSSEACLYLDRKYLANIWSCLGEQLSRRISTEPSCVPPWRAAPLVLHISMSLDQEKFLGDCVQIHLQARKRKAKPYCGDRLSKYWLLAAKCSVLIDIRQMNLPAGSFNPYRLLPIGKIRICKLPSKWFLSVITCKPPLSLSPNLMPPKRLPWGLKLCSVSVCLLPRATWRRSVQQNKPVTGNHAVSWKQNQQVVFPCRLHRDTKYTAESIALWKQEVITRVQKNKSYPKAWDGNLRPKTPKPPSVERDREGSQLHSPAILQTRLITNMNPCQLAQGKIAFEREKGTKSYFWGL